MIFIESTSVNPAFNLALEEYVFEVMPKEQEYFILWQNDNTIVVGKHQNTVEEINIPYMKEKNIHVVRRLSGGGAVYHDLGNVNFTFITNAGDIEKLNLQLFCHSVVKTLKKLGVTAVVSGRNDITINGQKFSGNAQYIKGGRIMHHGTLMFDSDLSVVADALQVSADKIESKGIKSVKSRVTNIRPHLQEDVDLEVFKAVLRSNMIDGDNVSPYQLKEQEIKEIEKIQQLRYDTWEWNYGKSPQYQIQKSRRIEGFGKIQVSMDVEGGIIKNFATNGDYFGDGVTQGLLDRIIGCRLEQEALERALDGFNLDICYSHLDTQVFCNILLAIE